MDDQTQAHRAIRQLSRIQFTTVDIFWITGFSAIVSFSLLEFGVDFIPLYATLGFFTIVSCCFVSAGRASPPYGAVTSLIPWLFVGLCGAMFSRGVPSGLGAFLVVGLFILVVEPAWHNTRNLLRLSMTCTTFGLLMWIFTVPNPLRDIYSLRKEYPLADISDRLTYETRKTKDVSDTKLELSNEVIQNLMADSHQSSDYGRASELQRLHSRTYENFIRANGFGAIRMRGLSPYMFETPLLPKIRPTDTPFADAEAEEFDRRTPRWEDVLNYYMPGKPSVDGDGFHRNSVLDFIHPETFGYIKSKGQVAGFLPHAFHLHPGEIDSATSDERWQLQQLQLVSLLRFPGPRVYLTEFLPKMDELSSEDIETRKLDDFESKSLKSLEAARDIVISGSSDELRMMGSIRANRTCMECHSVAYGDLLGAFSYRFLKMDSSEPNQQTVE